MLLVKGVVYKLNTVVYLQKMTKTLLKCLMQHRI